MVETLQITIAIISIIFVKVYFCMPVNYKTIYCQLKKVTVNFEYIILLFL